MIIRIFYKPSREGKQFSFSAYREIEQSKVDPGTSLNEDLNDLLSQEASFCKLSSDKVEQAVRFVRQVYIAAFSCELTLERLQDYLPA